MVRKSHSSDMLEQMWLSGSHAASDRVPLTSRTPATKAKMAQRIVKSAHEGIRDAHQLVAAAVAEGMVPALYRWLVRPIGQQGSLAVRRAHRWLSGRYLVNSGHRSDIAWR